MNIVVLAVEIVATKPALATEKNRPLASLNSRDLHRIERLHGGQSMRCLHTSREPSD
jgi:hypothetical protein